MPKITIGDVAEYAGVSQATVSRVLNGKATVDEALRHRVQLAIDELGYQPSRAARRLRMESHDVIGLIVSDIQNPHFVSVMKGVEEAAYTNDMNLLLCNSGEDSERLARYLSVMRAESVAGLIVVPTDDDSEALARLQESQIPVVILDRSIQGFEADIVRSDNEGGAYQLVTHLIENGYRRIAIIYPNIVTGVERYKGYMTALEEHGIDLDPHLICSGGHQIDNSYNMTVDLLHSMSPPDAIFTATNLMTIGALRAIRELKLTIPQDVALVGFDDLPWAEEFATPVTVVSQATYELGQRAVEVLLHRLNNQNAPYKIHSLPTRLVICELSRVSDTYY